MQLPWLLLALLQGALADLPEGKKFWWTALGDSYASGVGSLNYIGGQRCLRYDESYGQRLQKYTDLGGANQATRAFQNVVCSGAEVRDVEKYQLLDDDTSGIPSVQYGDRPKFGEPSMATLTIGGDDVDFPGILFNCILEAHIPGGPPVRTCNEQREHSWGFIRSDSLVQDISRVIGKIVDKARKGPGGDKFKLYVTGYGQFFNDKTPACDEVTFARTANPKDDGKKHTMMTTELRKDFNAMSRGLNDAIEKAVAEHTDKGVKFIDIDKALDGHRFCEEGVNEPDQKNPELWIWHYPYKEKDDGADENGKDFSKVISAANDKVFRGLSPAELNTKYPKSKDVDNAFYDAVDWSEVDRISDGDINAWWGYVVGNRAKLFHPQEKWHNWIEFAILDQYKKDTGDNPDPPQQPPPDDPPEEPEPDEWTYSFHTFTGKMKKGKFAFFVLPGKYGGEYSKRSIDGNEEAYNRPYPPSAHNKRIMIPPPPIDPDVLTKAPGQVHIWTQKGKGSHYFGPFDLDCKKPQDEWQGWPRDKTGLKWDLQMQSGHACASDKNLDGLHVRYASQYVDVPTGIKKGDCETHDNGVSCHHFDY
ncbi:MAG: hypothetical protein Q9217_006763 [Psora testacea]